MFQSLVDVYSYFDYGTCNLLVYNINNEKLNEMYYIK